MAKENDEDKATPPYTFFLSTLNQECSKCKKIKQLIGYIYTLVKLKFRPSQGRKTSLVVKETQAHA